MLGWGGTERKLRRCRARRDRLSAMETNAQLSHTPRAPAFDLPARGLDAPVPPASTYTTTHRRWNASFGQWALDSLDTIRRSIRQRRCSMVRSCFLSVASLTTSRADAIKTE